MRLAIMCILCALSLACVGESVASPGPPGVAPTLEPGQTQMRHPGDLAVSIMARMDYLSLASWECYFPIKIRGLVPRVLSSTWRSAAWVVYRVLPRVEGRTTSVAMYTSLNNEN